MINVKSFLSFVLYCFVVNQALAIDLEQVVSGGDVEDYYATKKVSGPSPYVIQSNDGEIATQKLEEKAVPDFMFNEHPEEVTLKKDPKRQFLDVGYTTPGSFETSENYLEIDKKAVVEDFRKHSSGAINIAFIKNDFNYDSTNDIINKTISEGYKHVKGGSLYFHNDQYFYRTNLLNSFWKLGTGVGYNSGRGIFVTGEQSDTTFKLWEIPLDLGVGLEIPISTYFKIAGTAGPSALVLYQNRNDFLAGEKGRNKIQVSYGQFANFQFKVNLSALSTEKAYDLYTDSKITNLYLNIEARYQNYQNFQDVIKISGTSLGIGFTFEYL
ncbi:MAG: hypothetical protein Q7U04_14220 [Bacteriovorax sp.]|nr:hypothetical protein [Bacteriovorax sp.]